MLRFNQPRAGLLLAAALSMAAPALVADEPSGQEARLLRNSRQLMFEGRRSGEGYFSADGRLMVFQRVRDLTGSDPVLPRLPATDPTRLLRGAGTGSFFSDT